MAFGVLMFLKTSLALSVTWWLALAFSLFAAGCVMLTATAPSTKEKSTPSLPPLFPPATYIPEVQPQGKKTVWIATLTLVLGMLAGIGLGYGSRDHELAVNRFTYTDVVILSKSGDKEFLIWPDKMKQQHITICPSSTVGWYEGETLSDWTFEQRNGCKRVISYHEKPKGEIDASIQTR